MTDLSVAARGDPALLSLCQGAFPVGESKALPVAVIVTEDCPPLRSRMEAPALSEDIYPLPFPELLNPQSKRPVGVCPRPREKHRACAQPALSGRGEGRGGARARATCSRRRPYTFFSLGDQKAHLSTLHYVSSMKPMLRKI